MNDKKTVKETDSRFYFKFQVNIDLFNWVFFAKLKGGCGESEIFASGCFCV